MKSAAALKWEDIAEGTEIAFCIATPAKTVARGVARVLVR
jgi:hypothetical protein